MDSTNGVNVFAKYDQDENRFTNGLVGLLGLAKPQFVRAFLRDLLGVTLRKRITGFCVQVKHDYGTADAELCGDGCRIWFETKIVSGDLDHADCQVCRHLKGLRDCPGRLKRLVLLTPDDSRSSYMKRILSKHGHGSLVLHLEWRNVYDYLSKSLGNGADGIFSNLVRQFLDQIHDCIFEQDYAGIIQKIKFGHETGIYPNTYLDEITGWRDWNTPRKYEKLDGKGRKLMLYDKYRGITAEVEIRKVERTRAKYFPWSNSFAPGTLRVYPKSKWIPLDRILAVLGFEKSGMTSRWNVTQEQYRQLTESRGKSKKRRATHSV